MHISPLLLACRLVLSGSDLAVLNVDDSQDEDANVRCRSDYGIRDSRCASEAPQEYQDAKASWNPAITVPRQT